MKSELDELEEKKIIRRDGCRIEFFDDLPDDKKKIKFEKLMKSIGHEEFTIDGISVYALNYKNAVRKVEKIKNKQ
jgi:hypothetical protein